MKCSIVAYYNSGFDMNNIPDTPLLLNKVSTVKTFNSVYVKQDRDIINLKIASTWNDIKDVDYLSINDGTETIYYFVLGINMLNDNVAQLTLKEDVLTTVGGAANLDIVDGWCTRRCVTDDKLFNNTYPENFSPKQNLEISNLIQIAKSTDNEDSVTIVGSTVALGTIGDNTATKYTDSDGNTVVVPRTPSAAGNTPVRIGDPDNTDLLLTNVIPNLNLYNFNSSQVQENISIARSLGIESSITACYRVPSNYITGFNEEIDLKQSTLKSNITLDSNSIPVNYGSYTPQNNKVNALFNTVHLISIASGDEAEYPIYYIADTKSKKAQFVYWADVSPDGCPFCRPYLYLGSTYYSGLDYSHLFLTGIKGAKWQNTPITFTSASGQYLIDRNYTVAEKQYNINRQYHTSTFGIQNQRLELSGQQLAYNTAMSSANQMAGLLSGDANSAIGLANTMGNMYFQARNIDLNRDMINAQNQKTIADIELSRDNARFAYESATNVVEPTIMFPRTNSIQNYVGNGFIAYRVGLTDEDKSNFDKYLTRYGYSTQEPLTKQCFTGRKNFNFVEAMGVSIGKDINVRRKNSIENIFNKGIRVWHVLPNMASLDSNPIVTS